MSPSQQQIRAQRAAAAQARRQSGTAPAVPAAQTVPAPAGEIDPAAQTTAAEPYRPQAFTPDLIPEPVEVEAAGELTPQEVDDLGHCEAAFANGNRAEWMKWKAAHAVRARRLHRAGGRTWPDYCQDQFGESESEVNRRIQQWPLLKAIVEQQDRPRAVPDSHVQRLLPMVEQHGQDLTARAYVALRVWAADRHRRVTASVVGELVDLAQAAEPPALTTADTFQLAIEAKPTPKAKRVGTSKKEHVSEAPTLEPAEAAGSHPNLGDPIPGAGSGSAADDEHREPQAEHAAAAYGAGGQQRDNTHPLAEQASQARHVLDGMRIGFRDEGLLQHASTDTLKAIMESALAIAEAAEDALKGR